jgi:hypothetical protein
MRTMTFLPRSKAPGNLLEGQLQFGLEHFGALGALPDCDNMASTHWIEDSQYAVVRHGKHDPGQPGKRQNERGAFR